MIFSCLGQVGMHLYCSLRTHKEIQESEACFLGTNSSSYKPAINLSKCFRSWLIGYVINALGGGSNVACSFNHDGGR